MNEQEELIKYYQTEMAILKPKYIFAPTGNPRDLAITVMNRPNFIARVFQRVILGFRYIPIDLK